MRRLARNFVPMDTDKAIDILAWRTGPLPDQRLEQLALRVFERQYPSREYGNPDFSAERNDARRFVLSMRIEFLKMDRWTVSNAAEQMTTQLSGLIFGDRALGKTIRKEVSDFADSVISDASITFCNRLFFTRDVEANNEELQAEAKHDR